MGNFRVPVEIAAPDEHRFERLDALVDTGATYSWVPRDLLEQLGVTPEEDWQFILADGTERTYPIGSARIRLGGRTRSTLVVFGEPGSDSLLGAFTLEAFGLAADPVNRRLIRVPALLKPIRAA